MLVELKNDGFDGGVANAAWTWWSVCGTHCWLARVEIDGERVQGTWE